MKRSRACGWLLICMLTLPAYAQLDIVTRPISEVAVNASFRALAEVVPPNQSALSVEVSGVVQAIPVDVASTVAKGDLLLLLDDTDLRLELAQAEALLAAAKARVEQAQVRLERANRLRDSEFISADDLLDRQTELRIQEAEQQRLKVARDLARRRLGYTRLLAPFAATVTQRTAQVGQRLSPGEQVMTLVDLARPHVIASIPARDQATLQLAESFRLETQRGSYALEFISAVPAIDAASRVSPARLAFDGQADLPGATGTVTWEVAGALIPVDLIVRRNGQLGVFVDETNCPAFVPLPAAEEGRPAPHQLPLDTAIVVSGQQRLSICPEAP
ncbi:MAG: efflux RND transporter periplasmic adaptor subunit [Pseudomonadota bacterium]